MNSLSIYLNFSSTISGSVPVLSRTKLLKKSRCQAVRISFDHSSRSYSLKLSSILPIKSAFREDNFGMLSNTTVTVRVYRLSRLFISMVFPSADSPGKYFSAISLLMATENGSFSASAGLPSVNLKVKISKISLVAVRKIPAYPNSSPFLTWAYGR